MFGLLNIILVEDNESLAWSLKLAFQLEGINLLHFASGQQLKQELPGLNFDLALLDVELPDDDGFKLISQIRKLKPLVPVIFLTARISEADVVKGLELGADDYIRKPFGNKELIARIRAALRPHKPISQDLEFEGISLNAAQLQMLWQGSTRQLRRREYELLEKLVQAAGNILSREQLMGASDRDKEIYDRTIDSHISHIREKLKDLTANKIKVTSVYGVGYRLECGDN